MAKIFEYGVGMTSVKAFNEGRITLWFHGRKGIAKREYNSKIWAIKAIQKAKNEGRSLSQVVTLDNRVILSFSRKE